MKKLLLASAVSLTALGASPAFARGAFDFLDPCIAARSEFADQRQQVRARYSNFESSSPTMTATPEFRAAWLRAKRQQARPLFNEREAPRLARLGVTDMDRAFDAWFTDMIASVEPQDLQNLINTSYRLMARQELARERAGTEAEFDKAKADLDGACRQDVGSQFLRVSMAPVGWVAGNIDGARREHNIITQVFRGVTGISARDIARQGILGGDNSEARRLVQGITGGPNSEVNRGARFLDPSNTNGILGGENSAPRVIGRQAERVLNPFRW